MQEVECENIAIYSSVLYKVNFRVTDWDLHVCLFTFCMNSHNEKRGPDCTCISQLTNQLVSDVHDVLLLLLRGVTKWLVTLCGN